MTTMPLIRLSERTLTLSLLSSPRREALAFWKVGLLEVPGRGVVEWACVVPRVRLLLAVPPRCVLAFVLFFDWKTSLRTRR